MSVSQVIAAWGTSLNRGSHMSGDTCHMMPPSLARRAGRERPHRAGVGPVRPFRTARRGGEHPVLRDAGWPALTPMGAGHPSTRFRPDRPTAFGCPGPDAPRSPLLPVSQVRVGTRARAAGPAGGGRGGFRRDPEGARTGRLPRRPRAHVSAAREGTAPKRVRPGRPGAGSAYRPSRRARCRRVRAGAAAGDAR
jgi:hypothetical protein